MKYNYTHIDIFAKIFSRKEAEFIRKTGMNQDKFSLLLSLIKAKIAAEKEENAMKKRGLKPSISLENQLLIALYYLRDYMTHLKLGEHFGISDGY